MFLSPVLLLFFLALSSMSLLTLYMLFLLQLSLLIPPPVAGQMRKSFFLILFLTSCNKSS
jgi:hypothetical protein